MSFGDLKVQDLIYEDSSNNEITVVIADLATKANPVFSGTVTVPTATAGDNSTKAASTAFVVASFAPKNAPAFTGSATGVNLTLSGDLTVNGTTTTINTTTLQVEDKNIEIGKVASPSDTTADGGGWTLLGATNKTFNWLNATDSWTSSEHIEIASGKNLKVDGTTFFVDGTNNRVGIGLTNPSYKVDILEAAGNGLRIKAGDASADIAFSVGSAGTADKFVIQSGGKVGIGGTPQQLLHVQTSSGDCIVRVTSPDGSGAFLDLGDASDPDGGRIVYDTGSNLILNTASSERLRISSAGAFGIAGANYGTSGQVLTSGGNSAAPSWANPAAGGNTFTAVANGAIANNKAVKIDTDGKVSEVKTTTGSRTTVQYTGAAIPLTITEKNEYIKVVNCGEDKVLAIFQKTSGTWQVNAQVGYHQSGHNYATWGSDTHIIANAGSIRIGVPDAVYIGNNKVIVAFQYDDDINLYMGTVNTSNNTVSFGATLTLAAFANHSPSLSYDPDNDNVLCCYSGTSNRGAAQVITWSGTTLSAGTTVYFPQISSNVGIGAKTATYDTNDNKHIVAFRYDDYNNRGYIVSVSVSGTTPTFGSLVQFCGTDTSTDNLGNNLLGIAFDDNVNKFALFYTAGSRCWRHVGSCSSGTISITPSDQASSIYTHGNGDIFPTIIFEPVSKAFVAMAVSSSGGTFNRYAQYAFFSLNANGTYANSSSANFMGDATKYTSVAHYGKTGEGLVVLVYQNYSASSGEEVAKSQDGITTQTVSTLTDPNRYVGYADQAYTNGQTATIKTYGNVVDTLSGLTTGTKYYVQGNGTLGTSWDNTVFPTDGSWYANTPLAGLAISASKLIIRDPYGMHHT
jgi:hypothetical protein